MHNKKIAFALLLSLCMIIALAGYAFAASFSDVQGHWAESQINKWAEKGLAGGFTDGTFKPNNEVTRAEFVALTNRAFGIKNDGAQAGFKDVVQGKWYYNEVAAAKAAGYIGGYTDGTFRPDQTITRQEVASILVRLLKLEQTTQGLDKFADAGQFQDWARASIGAVAKAELMRGFTDNTFKPLNSITRAEAVVSLDRAMGYEADVVTTAIEGIVTLDGKSVASATIRVFEAGSYKVLKETTSGSNGKFKVELQAGDYDITATTENEVAYASDVKVTSAKVAIADLSLEAAAIVSGVLEDKKGKAVKNTTILYTTNPTFVAKTDTKGEYTVRVLPNRNYQVSAYDPDKEDAEPEVVKSSLQVGIAGAHDIGALQAPFTVASTPVGGGGGGGGGGGPKIKSIADIKVTVALKGNYSLPSEVTANMSDNTTKQVAVTWSPNTVNTSKAGVFAFQGTVSGYAPKIKLTLRVEAPMGQPVEVDNDVPLAFAGGVTIDLTSVPNVPVGVTVTVTECSDSDYKVPGEQPGQVFKVAGKVIKVQFSSNADFTNGVELTLPFEGAASDDLAIFYYNETDEKWECADSTVDETNKVIRATVYHFSKWGVVKATRVATPTAAPPAGSVDKGAEIELSTSTAGAKIYYTKDGKNPNAPKHRKLYDGPITINENTTIKAVAIKDNMKNSHVATFEYTVSGTPEPKPYIQNITNGTVDQQNKVITLSKNPSNVSESNIELYSPSGQSVLDIKLNQILLGSWDFENGLNDISLGNSIAGVNISATVTALLGAGLSHQDVLDAVNFSQIFTAIKNSSSKQAFYDDVLAEVIEIASDNIDEDGRKEIYAALNIPAIKDAANQATKQRIKEILQPAVDVYNNCPENHDQILVENLVNSGYENVWAMIDASDCKDDFYNAISITGLYDAIISADNYSTLIDAINENSIIDAIISQDNGITTLMAMGLVVYDYLDSLDTDDKKEIYKAVNINQLMVVVCSKVGNDLKVIVKDNDNNANQTIYTVTVEQ